VDGAMRRDAIQNAREDLALDLFQARLRRLDQPHRAVALDVLAIVVVRDARAGMAAVEVFEVGEPE